MNLNLEVNDSGVGSQVSTTQDSAMIKGQVPANKKGHLLLWHAIIIILIQDDARAMGPKTFVVYSLINTVRHLQYLSHEDQEDEELEDKEVVLTHCAATVTIYAAAARGTHLSKDRYNGTTRRLAALKIRTYDDWVFNASRKRGPGGPDDLAGRKYGSRTRLDIGQFPPPSLFTCENLYSHPSKLSTPLSVVTIALPSLRNIRLTVVLPSYRRRRPMGVEPGALHRPARLVWTMRDVLPIPSSSSRGTQTSDNGSASGINEHSIPSVCRTRTRLACPVSICYIVLYSNYTQEDEGLDGEDHAELVEILRKQLEGPTWF
ncbi:hypothetical protein ARMGADRAFT_1022680 [Armillaria gallica]|uniref:Uncharacterized protein n=1 Tax=Armillaria gallica TaxID=47427 RepID=A0A2H3EXY4_ARMGA|nr:hypothetical protein ARMGADRAFT_1022680 [Armillaria gallica]